MSMRFAITMPIQKKLSKNNFDFLVKIMLIMSFNPDNPGWQ